MSFSRRSSGVLLHLGSLPGPYGSGDLGPPALAHIDWLASARQAWWQFLPIHPPGPDGCPYQASSSYAGSPGFVDLDALAEAGLLRPRQLAAAALPAGDRVDHERVRVRRERALRAAFAAFDAQRRAGLDELAVFRHQTGRWLADWALYAAAKQAHGGAPWFRWELGLRRRERGALASARRALAAEICYHEFVQLQFERQWSRLRVHARAHGLRLFGDLPMFVAHDSADVWANQRLFALDRDGNATHVAGTPPDYFCADGQLWGLPVYRWERHRQSGFRWWIERLGRGLELFDALRLDHFIGFVRTWSVTAEESNARHGTYELGPGQELFRAAAERLGALPLAAEDLGNAGEDVHALRDQQGFPGMRVLQFAFGGTPGENLHLPHHHPPNSIAYTGTHDNDTAAGWFAKLPRRARPGAADEATQARVLEYLGGRPPEIHWQLVRAAWNSSANTAIAPVQDLLGLDARARMNVPGTTRGNWCWRLRPGQLDLRLAERLRAQSESAGRAAAAR